MNIHFVWDGHRLRAVGRVDGRKSATMVDSEEKAETLKQIVRKLMLERGPNGHRQFLTRSEVIFVSTTVIEPLKNDGSLAEFDPPVIICGDTHGQFYDLIRLFDHGGWPPVSRYLFLGDYVDRGPQGVEVACMMFALKIAFPNNFYILRGNHECSNINRVYGLWEECRIRYDADVYWAMNQAFAYLPVAGLVGQRIFCMHGGLSPEMVSFDQIRQIERPLFQVGPGVALDLLWADPAPGITGFMLNHRGVSYLFGEDVVYGFCNYFGIDMIARAHQVVMQGYEFFAEGRMLTIFSAPRYCNQFENAAGMMLVNDDLTCKITLLSVAGREHPPT